MEQSKFEHEGFVCLGAQKVNDKLTVRAYKDDDGQVLVGFEHGEFEEEVLFKPETLISSMQFLVGFGIKF